MTDQEYLDRAESLLARVEQVCDAINARTSADIDNQRTGGMLTLGFGDGSQIVINLQKPLQEVWLADRAGGYHYRLDGQVWRDTKSGEAFYARLSASASAHAGMALVFGEG
jgi:CyaY protein